MPTSVMAGYAGKSLAGKPGIQPGKVVALPNAPESFPTALGALPDDVVVRTHARGCRDLTVWFVRSLSELESRIDRLADQVSGGALWIAWPKKASSVESDLSQPLVRRVGLASGLVDYKICRIDDTWAALKFAARSQLNPGCGASSERP